MRFIRIILGLYLEKVQKTAVYKIIAQSIKPNIAIGEASEEDMKQVHAWLNPSNPVQSTPRGPNITNFVAKKGKKVIGFCQLIRRQQENNPCVKYFIYALNVRPFYRRMGIGETLSKTAMLKAKNQGAKDILLKVTADNRRAIQLYSKLGFKAASVSSSGQNYREATYLIGHNEIVMLASLEAFM
jgi:ribosomal protein S18 acetylase RimI-like enzyme